MKKAIRKISFLLLILATLPALSGCNNEDDVIGIFVGKTWKLTFIAAEGTQKQYNFWGEKGMSPDNPMYINSMNELGKESTFIINFEGADLNGTTGGSFNAIGTSTTVNGSWNANGESNKLTINIVGDPSDKDVLGKAFITGLKKATRYEGDDKNLYIYYNEGQTTKFMAFRVR